MKSLAKAISIASSAFENSLDKGGQPYILHCLFVMNEVKSLGQGAMTIAVLHDLLEDTIWTSKTLYEAGFDEFVVSGVEMLTHKKEEDYMDYIKRVATSPTCRAIKIADLRHNTEVTRLRGLTKKDFDRLEKYLRAYEYLRQV